MFIYKNVSIIFKNSDIEQITDRFPMLVTIVNTNGFIKTNRKTTSIFFDTITTIDFNKIKEACLAGFNFFGYTPDYFFSSFQGRFKMVPKHNENYCCEVNDQGSIIPESLDKIREFLEQKALIRKYFSGE